MLAEAGLVNIVGGCCGTTPEHIEEIKKVVSSIPPRVIENSGSLISDLVISPTNNSTLSHSEFCNRWPHNHTTFSGLEAYAIRPDTNFTMVGERTNVTGSAKFRRLIQDNDFDGAFSCNTTGKSCEYYRCQYGRRYVRFERMHDQVSKSNFY